MSTSRRASKKRPVPRFLYAPASKWTLAEYEFLNVDDEVKPWRDMLDFKASDEDLLANETLQKLLSSFDRKARDVTNADIKAMLLSNRLYLAPFYQDVRDLVMDTTEDEFDNDIIDNTPSPKEVKRVRYDRAAKPSIALNENAIPKSSSLQSISSVSSDKQGQRESKTRAAFFSLLNHISRHCLHEFFELLVDPHEFVGTICLQFQQSPVRVENDGSIRLRDSKIGNLPFLNVECKSRAGSSSLEVYHNIFAQEFGESLAIMLARLKAIKYVKDRCTGDLSWVVYSIGIHHGRAYLARVDFDPEYIRDCEEGVLNNKRVTVVRSECNYRLDNVTELREMVTMIYCLCRQFMTEIQAGRLA